MGKTIVEKILSYRTGKNVKANDIVITHVDGVMATDTTAPLSIKAFESMGGTKVFDPSKCCLIIDHAAPAPNEKIANLHQMMRDFAREQGIKLYDIGEGICHQILLEQRHIQPGWIFMGADSHTPTGGAIGALACGMGSTDIGAILLTGKTWLKTPQTIKITCSGRLKPGVHAKDLILFLTGKITISGATYLSVEFHGDTFQSMNVADRMCIANMLAEMGAKTGFVHPDGLELPYVFEAILPDIDAQYCKVYSFDVSNLQPQIAAPESPDNVMNIDRFLGKKIDYAFVGTCGNGRLEDLQTVASVLKGRKIADGVRMVIAPASRKVLLEAMLDGTAHTLIESGATIINPGCGPCVGTHEGIPGNGESVISAANRNFRGRMGNPSSEIYLAAPATVAASALTGEITHPLSLTKN
jgi:3-isopropylmalate/(R)-2-methylmalate dehydratase large subunit